MSALCAFAGAQNLQLTSGNASLSFVADNGSYRTELTYQGMEIDFLAPGNPAYAEVAGRAYSAPYSTVTSTGSGFRCVAFVRSGRGSILRFTDTYEALQAGQIELTRSVKVDSVAPGDKYFLTAFSVKTAANTNFTDNEYFIPGVLYKGNWDAACKLPSHLPQVSDVWHIYRDDRTPLPLVMSRAKSSGVTVTLGHIHSTCRTVMADIQSASYNAGYQFGSVGIWRDTVGQANYEMVYFPGTTKATASGRGNRYHPMDTSVKHDYGVLLDLTTTNDYPSAVKRSWNEVFEQYDPAVYPVDQNICYEGLIQSLLTYYVPQRTDGGTYDRPGFPFEVSLADFQPRGIDYQMGFVGMQVAAGYCLMRYGIENNDATIRHKGDAVLDFWANDCLTKYDLPKTWYDPSQTGTGSWRNYNSILRVMTGGFESLIEAWCFATKNGQTHDNWKNACVRFGNWMVANQNANGSFAFSWNHTRAPNGVHPVVESNGLTTTSAIRYLVELYIATGDERYKEAAIAAGEYSLIFVHRKYHYCACVVDNPQVIDSESGLMAIYAFEALYDLTREQKWLDAWIQAADYYETWVYSFEIPVEDDRSTEDYCTFPRDRSIVGQHLIAIGHSAADLGFAWGSFGMYRLYLLTGNEHYLKMARISAHNSKQSMNWDQSLYPDQPRGLQLEAFQVMIPRRVNGVNTTLNWNYAGHLDPMLRFKDAFGTPDIEEVERMSMDDRLRLASRYANYQGADYGQIITSVDEAETEALTAYPNPLPAGGRLHLLLPAGATDYRIVSTTGMLVDEGVIGADGTIRVDLPQGIYSLVVNGCGKPLTKRITVK